MPYEYQGSDALNFSQCYSFTTSNQITYLVYFNEAEYFNSSSYKELIWDFGFDIFDVPVEYQDYFSSIPRAPGRRHKAPPKDERIGKTINKIINDFFNSSSDHVLVYTCSPEDGQHEQRKRKFDMWYRGCNLTGFEKHDSTVQGTSKIFINSLILKETNSYKAEIIDAYQKEIVMRNEEKARF